VRPLDFSERFSIMLLNRRRVLTGLGAGLLFSYRLKQLSAAAAAAKAQPFLLTGKPVFRQRFYHPVLKMDCLKRSITDFGGVGL